MPEKPVNEKTIYAEETKLGAAQRAKRDTVRARALASDLLQPSDLDKRQKSIGKKRRSGGPALDEEPTEEQQASTPSAAQTDCEDPSD